MTNTLPCFRFAPSPNGHLHLGHALSALLNGQAAQATGGKLLLRIENIDTVRCTARLEADLLEDLARLGLRFEAEVWRQSDRFSVYGEALNRLEALGVTYRAYLTRAEIRRHVASQESSGVSWPRDPDGAPLYPRDELVLSGCEIARRRADGAPFALRLDMAAALSLVNRPLFWWEGASEFDARAALLAAWDEGQLIEADPAAWGDVVLARKDCPTSYHVSVVVDDAAQEVTDVIRGRDLYHATSVHRLLQELLGLPAPRYRHHRLIAANDGMKLSKSSGSQSLRERDFQISEIYSILDLVDR
ncbi:tRNA glutamyl-Q(34) synthetase GluQRS [Roseibium sp.]|uniref:tRNA glutamyl-Q(34) synthetase GluQRS n=1 Tax=Roseibium sp. TaxID=1936156 RepID=UPI003A969BA8